ncbi:MAG: CsgG/HfaB family protein [Gracilimonas sp.]
MISASVKYIIGIFLLAAISNCTGVLKPVSTDRATAGLISESYDELVSLPEPNQKVVAAVYRFRDQTGQYKPSENVASWSTAVTQGATSILIKSLEDSGWFMPIEREGISNLLNERQIIQSIRSQNSGPSGPDPLPPLLFAGVILEGGIVGYDTNIITGGSGVRYLGTGGSSNYRKDQVTIYLRAVSTQSGRVLKTVHTTKSIISQQLESGLFRYVDVNRILEAETGYTYNEPPVMAVTEAIDEAVKQLIIEGAEDGVWSPKDSTQLNQFKERVAYESKMKDQLQRDYFGLIQRDDLRSGWFVASNFLVSGHEGNYASPEKYIGGNFSVERGFKNRNSLQLQFERTAIGATGAFSEPITTGELFFNSYLTPQYKFSPFISAGGGVVAYDKKQEFTDQQIFSTATFKAGLDYRFSDIIGLRLTANYKYLITDELDGITRSGYNDQIWSVNAGVVIKPKILKQFF